MNLKGKELDNSKLQLPRMRQLSKRVDRGQSDAHFPRTEQDYYRSIYFQKRLGTVSERARV